jgi:SAM-dependent methyltransferase
MEIDTLKRHWEAFGRDDPLWAVLTESSRTGGRWELDEFLQRGEGDVAQCLAELEDLGVSYERGRALDFGCGVGRLTQALADRFERCDGVDIADSMIAEARRINRHGDRVQYHVNDAPNLGLFPSGTFDFVLSFIVLQHMEPRYSKAYIGEFVRVLRPGGVAVFQLPSAPATTPPDAMPDGAWRATISLEGRRRPRQLEAGRQQLLRVRVRNDGTTTWPADAHVRLGNRWSDQSGRVLVMDDGRTDLPGELAPGRELALDLLVTAPHVTGKVRLELDMVQEQVGWFGSRGSRALRIPLTITPNGQELPPADAAAAPRMEMHAVPQEEVVAIVREAGGEVLHQLPDISAGAAFEGFRYIVRRTSTVDPPLPRQSLTSLDEAITAIPERWDMFPPVISRRRDRVGDFELLAKRVAARALRWLTWAQTEHDHSVKHALAEARSVLAEQRAELQALRNELAELRAQKKRDS